MLSKNQKIIAVIIILLLSITTIVSTWVAINNKNTINKTAYVDVSALFEHFDMKKELQAKLSKDLNEKQYSLDSLMFQLQGLKNKIESNKGQDKALLLKFQQFQNYYVQQQRAVEDYSYQKTTQFDAQILEQMTQYVKDYGKKNQYDYIYGLNSEGNIMYAPESRDITKEVTKYINDSYQGLN